jgi:hypothetical protein
MSFLGITGHFDNKYLGIININPIKRERQTAKSPAKNYFISSLFAIFYNINTTHKKPNQKINLKI